MRHATPLYRSDEMQSKLALAVSCGLLVGCMGGAALAVFILRIGGAW